MMAVRFMAAAQDRMITGAEMKRLLSQKDSWLTNPESVGSFYDRDEFALVQSWNSARQSGLTKHDVIQQLVAFGVDPYAAHVTLPNGATFVPSLSFGIDDSGFIALDKEASAALAEFAQKSPSSPIKRAAKNTAIGWVLGGPVWAGAALLSSFLDD